MLGGVSHQSSPLQHPLRQRPVVVNGRYPKPVGVSSTQGEQKRMRLRSQVMPPTLGQGRPLMARMASSSAIAAAQDVYLRPSMLECGDDSHLEPENYFGRGSVPLDRPGDQSVKSRRAIEMRFDPKQTEAREVPKETSTVDAPKMQNIAVRKAAFSRWDGNAPPAGLPSIAVTAV